MRRRLKLASLIFDEVLLEAGMLRVSAGPTGASSFISHAGDIDSLRWQTPRERSVAMQSRFNVFVGNGDLPGVPAEQLREFINSETSISWNATLMPFAREFSSGCDWMHFVRPEPGRSVKQLANEWTNNDKNNASLRDAIPVKFVRNTVIAGANNDLALAAGSGVAVSIDSLHQQVVAQRFKDAAGWHLRGFAMPILLPNVQDLPWESIVEMRKNRHMGRFRAVLRGIEDEVREVYRGGDVKDVVHRIFERHQSDVFGEVEGLGAGVKKAAGGLVIGGATGVATMGIMGIGGLIVGTVLGTAIQSVFDVTKIIRERRARGWLSVYNELRGAG